MAEQAASFAVNTREGLRQLGFELRMPPLAIISFDPAGDGDDNNAVTLQLREEHEKGERHEIGFEHQMVLRLHLMQRLRNDMEYPEILAALLNLHRCMMGMRARGRIFNHVFVVETNGVGHGYYHALRKTIGNRVVGQFTTGGDKEQPINEAKLTMPRMAGLDWFRFLIESHVVKIAKDPVTGEMAPGAEDFRTEMQSFVWRGPKRPAALEGQRDDLVMSAAIGTWIGTKVLPPLVKASAMTKPPRKAA